MTFLLLAAEMVTFGVLIAPLPYAIRKKFFRFLSESPAIAKLAYGLKITFMCVPVLLALSHEEQNGADVASCHRFVGVLFVDALQRMWRVTEESEIARNTGGGMHDARAETTLAARKF